VILTLGLAEVWRDVKADVFINRTPIPSLLETEPDRYEFHLTGFVENMANLEAYTRAANPVWTPRRSYHRHSFSCPLMNTFSTMDIV